MIALTPEVQLLLRDFQEEWTRACELLEHGSDAVILAQTMHSAGESLTTAADEIARHARARRAAPACSCSTPTAKERAR